MQLCGDVLRPQSKPRARCVGDLVTRSESRAILRSRACSFVGHAALRRRLTTGPKPRSRVGDDVIRGLKRRHFAQQEDEGFAMCGAAIAAAQLRPFYSAALSIETYACAASAAAAPVRPAIASMSALPTITPSAKPATRRTCSGVEIPKPTAIGLVAC